MVKLVRLSEPATHLLPELGLLLRVKVSPDPFSILKKNWLVKTTTFPSCVGRLELLESGDRLTSERELEVDLYRIKVGLDKWPLNVECPFCGSTNLEGPYTGDTCWYCLHCKSWIDFSDFEEAEAKA